MKTFEYRFDLKPGIREYLFREMYFNENKKEKEILDGLCKGKTCYQIGNELGYSDRTIVRRRKELYNKVKDYI